MNLAANPAVGRQKGEDSEHQNLITKKFEHVPNVDALSLNLTKCFYSLRQIKTRKMKIQLLHVLNYFRAI